MDPRYARECRSALWQYDCHDRGSGDGRPGAVTVFSTDASRNETFDAIHRTYFHAHCLARGLVGTSTLQHGAHFEVLGVAVKPSHLQL
jgi:hypothetical protein